MASVPLNKAQASAAIEAAHAKLAHLLPEGVLHDVQRTARQSASHSGPILSSVRLIFSPDLPPMLAPIPGLCRLIAFLIIAPVIVLCLTDFAGYAIFRTLGFRRRRIRVKRGGAGRSSSRHAENAAALGDANIHQQQRRAPQSGIDTDSGSPFASATGASSSTTVRAPLLTPGAYDADTLLRHRARSISGESVEAEEEWARTGGRFARVSNVRANQAASTDSAAAVAATSFAPASVPTSSDAASLISPPDSPRHTFARARNVGVEGALGYSDTEAEDSGAESGRNSPEIGRKTWQKRGLSSRGFSFTPVSTTNEQYQPYARQAATESNANPNEPLNVHAGSPFEGVQGLGVDLKNKATVADVPVTAMTASTDTIADRSPRLLEESITSSWIGVNEDGHEEPQTVAARAADLEPSPASPS